MRYLITGGAGFIGSNLSRYLLNFNEKVTIVDDLSTSLFDNIENFNCDFYQFHIGYNSKNDIDDLIKNSDIVFHLAATVGVKNVIEDSYNTIINNIQATEIVLEACKKYRKKCFIASTSEVYGKNTNILKETDDLKLGSSYYSRWSYATSKLIDEFLTLNLSYKYKLPFTILRFFNISGPGQIGRYGMVIPRFIDQAFHNENLSVFGDGEQTRCFIHIDDVVDILYKLIYCKNINGKIINIGNPEEIKIIDLAKYIIESCSSSSKIEIHSEYNFYGSEFEDMKRRFPNISVLKEILEVKNINFKSYKEIVNDILKMRK